VVVFVFLLVAVFFLAGMKSSISNSEMRMRKEGISIAAQLASFSQPKHRGDNLPAGEITHCLLNPYGPLVT
jgi:hypothetical protein